MGKQAISMVDKENKGKQEQYEKFRSRSHGDLQYRGSEWIGTIVYYVADLCRKPFEYYAQKKYHSRNVWTGYVIKLIVVIALFVLLAT